MNAEVNIPKKEFILAAKDRVEGLIKWKSYIEKALARNGTYLSYTEICQRVLAGHMLWFDNKDAFAICELVTFQRGTYCHIMVAGGKYSRMCDLEREEIVPLLKVGGITRITTLGRNGFLRREKPDGWKPTNQQFFVKEIE